MISCIFEDGNKALLRHVTVDVIVVKDDKVLLMQRSKKLMEGGKWGLTGGYLDRDESLDQGARREVMEESGWKIGDLTLLTIRDDISEKGEDRQNIKFVYFAEGLEKVAEPHWESDDVRWFPLSGLPAPEQIAFDHLDRIKLYEKYRKENLALPILPH